MRLGGRSEPVSVASRLADPLRWTACVSVRASAVPMLNGGAPLGAVARSRVLAIGSSRP